MVSYGRLRFRITETIWATTLGPGCPDGWETAGVAAPEKLVPSQGWGMPAHPFAVTIGEDGPWTPAR